VECPQTANQYLIYSFTFSFHSFTNLQFIEKVPPALFNNSNHRWWRSFGFGFSTYSRNHDGDGSAARIDGEQPMARNGWWMVSGSRVWMVDG
jgi:hypothetical protein